MSAVLLLLRGSIGAPELDDALEHSHVGDAERFVALAADDDPLRATAYGARWPYTATVSIDAPGRGLVELVDVAARVLDRLDAAVDRSASALVAGTTHRVIDGRTSVALVYAIRRRMELTDQQYREHWRDRHGPLAKRLVPTRGYEQLHADPTLTSRACDDLGLDRDVFDGVATCFFDTREDFAAMLAARDGDPAMKQISEDELRFLDHDRSLGAMVRAVGRGLR